MTCYCFQKNLHLCHEQLYVPHIRYSVVSAFEIYNCHLFLSNRNRQLFDQFWNVDVGWDVLVTM